MTFNYKKLEENPIFQKDYEFDISYTWQLDKLQSKGRSFPTKLVTLSSGYLSERCVINWIRFSFRVDVSQMSATVVLKTSFKYPGILFAPIFGLMVDDGSVGVVGLVVILNVVVGAVVLVGNAVLFGLVGAAVVLEVDAVVGPTVAFEVIGVVGVGGVDVEDGPIVVVGLVELIGVGLKVVLVGPVVVVELG